MNKNLLNMVRSMIFFKNVKLMFWREAILYETNIKNRCPSSVINKKSPYELWYNRLPAVHHFKVFGSTCYALIPKHQRNKLNARSRKCIFLGYSSTSKVYKSYDEVNKKKKILSRDVIFLESAKYFSTIDRQLAHLDNFTSKKIYFESANTVPRTEGGIHILDLSVGFPSLIHEDIYVEENLEDNIIPA